MAANYSAQQYYTPANANFSSAQYGPVNVSPKPSTAVLGLSGKAAIPASGMSSQYASNPSNYKPATQQNTGGSVGGGDSQLQSLLKIANPDPYQQSLIQQLTSAQNSAANSGYDAELSSANSAYDYARENLSSQIPQLEGQRDRAISDLDLGLSGVRTQTESAKMNAQTNNDKQIRQAGSIAKSTTQQNRNVLRSLGIINSSAAGELLSKPNNEFASQRAELGVQLNQRIGELDQFLTQKVAEAKNAKEGIIAQFTDLYGKIQSDLRFNERQRTDAVKAATASLQERLAQIQSSVFNYQTQVESQKQQFAQGLAQVAAYNNPSIAKDYLSSMNLTNPTNQAQTAAIYNPVDPKKKQGLSAV